MSFQFDPAANSIILPVTLVGPLRSLDVSLVLDTGAVQTLIAESLLKAIGYDPAAAPKTKSIITASGVVSVPEITIGSIEALGKSRNDFAVIAHTLPPSAGVDGLLGVDFFRGERLTIDFANGYVDLN
jgi:predicted aspartyl protease